MASKLERILEWREELNGLKLQDRKRLLLSRIDELLEGIKVTAFSEDEIETINRLHNALYSFHYRHFGDEREKTLARFHEIKGKAIYKTILHIIDEVPFPGRIKEIVFELVGDYLDLEPLKAWDESVVVTKRLIELLEERTAEGWELGYAYLKFSERVLMLFKDPDNMRLSSEYMEIADYYFKQYREEEEWKTLRLVSNKKLIHEENEYDGRYYWGYHWKSL